MSREKRSADQNTEHRNSQAFRRELRAGYHAIHNRINEGKDEIASADSPMFNTILKDVEKLHHEVVRPREQVTDAEVILNLTNTLLDSAKSHSLGAFSPANFVSALKRHFGADSQGILQSGNASDSIRWKAVGNASAHVFQKGIGCRTMIGPMELEFKRRKSTALFTKRSKLAEKEKPKKVNPEEESESDLIVAKMFGVLKKNHPAKLENGVLNSQSFAQTVENVFALSFLVRDGRVVIEVDDNGSQIVSPKNASSRRSIVRGDVAHSHFIFRFDFQDWKRMIDSVPRGEELMPHRMYMHDSADEPKDEHQEEFETKNVEKLPDTPPPVVSEEDYELKLFEMAESSSRKRRQETTGTGRTSHPKSRRKLF